MNFRWINIFLRDIILIGLISWVNWRVDYQSWWAACITGMIIVLITWHFQDFLETNRRLPI